MFSNFYTNICLHKVEIVLNVWYWNKAIHKSVKTLLWPSNKLNVCFVCFFPHGMSCDLISRLLVTIGNQLWISVFSGFTPDSTHLSHFQNARDRSTKHDWPINTDFCNWSITISLINYMIVLLCFKHYLASGLQNDCICASKVAI